MPWRNFEMNKLVANYTVVSETTAKIAKNINSYSEYIEGSAEKQQKEYTDKLVNYANNLLDKTGAEDLEKIEKCQNIIDSYSKKVANMIDDYNRIEAQCPSVMICGAGNFPTKKKEKQNTARDSHFKKYGTIYSNDNYYFDKINNVLIGSGVIRSDDKNAVEKIKNKIESLKNESDPYGYNKVEIRRLKQRLLELSPDEVKSGINVTINGLEATFENIVKIFDSYKPRKSIYNDDDESNEYYLNIPLVFSDGKRNYKEFVQNQVDEKAELLYTYGNSKNNYQTIWINITDIIKFKLIISKIRGSGNKAVIYSILKDLEPRMLESKENIIAQETFTINGEDVEVKKDTDIVRLQLLFSGKPNSDTRNILKSNGFKWAPSQGAWQRLLNDNALRALKRIIDEEEKEDI